MAPCRAGETGLDSGYTVRESARAKYLQLKIGRYGEVEVVLPRGMSRRHVAPFVARHHDWIEAQRRRHRRRGGEVQQGLPQQVALTAVGEHWQVHYQSSPSSRLSCRRRAGHDCIVVRSPDEQRSRSLLQRWLSRQGRYHLVPWLQRVSEETGLAFSGVSIRGQKTRWGSCNRHGHISLNRSLLLLAPATVRYVLVHELCHTLHLNHSAAYWRCVERFAPDYRLHERLLNEAAFALPQWLTH